MVASVLQLVGLCLIALAVGIWLPLLGVAAFGAVLLIVGLALERY